MAIDFNAIRKAMTGVSKTVQESVLADKSKETNFWKPTRNEKTNTSEAEVRLLPLGVKDLEAIQNGTAPAHLVDLLMPVLCLHNYSFKGTTGKWLNAVAPKTLGLKDDPITEWSAKQWGMLKQKFGENKKHPEYVAVANVLKKYFAQENKYVGVYVVNDKYGQEHNGKCYLMRLTSSLSEIINDAISPKFDGEPALEPFDLINGANLLLRASYNAKTFNDSDVMVADYKGNTKFAAPSALFDGDETKLMEVMNNAIPLHTFLNEEAFLSNEKLKEKFCAVMGFDENYNSVSNGGVPDKVVGSVQPALAAVTQPATSAPVEPATPAKPSPSATSMDNIDDELDQYL